MAVVFGQHLGQTEYSASASTTSALSISKTVATTDFIVIVAALYLTGSPANESATDNLGNTYTFREHKAHATLNRACAILTSPVTVGGTLTTVTVTHTSTQFRTIMGFTLTGVGTFSAVGGGLTANAGSTLGTWASSVTIPANGVAFGGIVTGTNLTQVAGAVSGSPSTAITLDTYYGSPGSAAMSVGAYYSIAGSSAVTTFTGTGTYSSGDSNAAAGAIFDAAAITGLTVPLRPSLSRFQAVKRSGVW